MKELQVNLGDVLLKILLKWRAFLVCIIIAGVALGILGMAKNSNNGAQVQEPVSIVTLDSLKNALPVSEQESVELAAEGYLSIKKLLDAKTEHYNHSIKEQIEYDNIAVSSVTYRIDTKDEAVYPVVSVKDVTNDILKLYMKKVLSTDTYEYISSEMGWDLDARCVKELITLISESDELFSIQVIGREREEAEAVAAIMKSKIDEATVAVKESFPDFEISIVDEVFNIKEDTNFLNDKKEMLNEFSLLKNDMAAIEASISGNQVAYFSALVNGIPESATNPENVPTEPAGGVAIDFKYIIIGCFLGAVLCLVYVLCKYVFSGSLRNSKEMMPLIDANTLGEIYISGDKKKFMKVVDCFIYKMFGVADVENNENVELVCSNIRVSMKKKNLQKVCLVTSCESEAMKNVLEELKDKVSSETLEADFGLNVLKNAEMLEKMLMADGVVIVEKENVSKYIDIQRMSELCAMHQIPILGGVVVNEI